MAASDDFVSSNVEIRSSTSWENWKRFNYKVLALDFSYTWVVFVLVNHTYFTGSGSFNNLDEPGLLNNLSNDVMDWKWIIISCATLVF